MRKFSTKELTLAAVTAAVYAVLTLCLPLQHQGVQFRVAESLTLLPFCFPWATPGVIVGCLLSNLLGSPYVLDWIFGTLATALACALTARMPGKWLTPLPPVLCNALIVGTVIAWSMTGGFGEEFWLAWAVNGLGVALGELVVCCGLGLPLLTLLSENDRFRDLLPGKRT